MGDMPDDRRAHQEPQKANGGDGSQRHAGNHFPGFLGHAVAERDNGRGAKAHQQEPQRGGPQHREQDGDQQPRGNEDAAGAQNPYRTEAHHQAVCRKTPQGHGAHECHIPHLHQPRAGFYHAFKIHAAPVKHGSLAHHASESDQSDDQYIGIHAPEHAAALSGGTPGISRQKIG